MTANALAVIETVPIDGPAVKATEEQLKLPDLSDEMLGRYFIAIVEHQDEFKRMLHAIDLEFELRIRERNARELPHAAFDKIALEDQWTAYTYDFDLLKKAQQLLRDLGKDEDAAKICRHVPEYIIPAQTIAAHDEAGAAASIAAIIRRYGEEHEISKLLIAGQSRESLGQKLVKKIKPVTA
ncbi:MAG TPA: hypothetical protein VGF86_02555 [Candidatus Tumulicola sp.]|jgi:hypothetical protein